MEFVDAHRWAIAAVAKAQLLIDGGIEDGLHWLQNPPRILWLHLKRRVPRGLPEESHFTCLFNVDGYSFITVEQLRDMYGAAGAAEWDRIIANRAPDERSLASYPLYECSLPVYYSIKEIPGIHYTSFFPLYKSTIPHVLARYSPERQAEWHRMKHQLVQDALYFCLHSIDSLFPLRILDEDTSDGRVPLPGRFVRSRGTRVWRPFFTDWNDYRPGFHAGLDDAVRNVRRSQDDIQTFLNLFSMM